MTHDTSQSLRMEGGRASPTPGEQRDSWDVAQVCLRGHLVNDRVRGNPAANRDSCSTCGSETISECPGCREPVPGFMYAGGRGETGGRFPEGRELVAPPRYCPACGRPFPWTERVMSAVRIVIREMTALNRMERDQLRRSIEHITRQTPQTPQAVRHINDALARIGGESAESLRAMFLSIASAEIRQQLAGAE